MYEGLGRLGAQPFPGDDRLEFGVAAGAHEGEPLLVDRPVCRQGIDEVLDEVALVPQGRAGIDGPGDLGANLLVVAVSPLVAVPLDEHEDVVDVDLDLLDELDLEDDVVVDRLLVAVAVLAELGVEVEVDAAVVLVCRAVSISLPAKSSNDVRMFCQAQDRTEQGDELLLRRSRR
jgi:hypothetical protein